MSTIQEILERVTAFLADRKESDGGWPEVTNEELLEMRGIFEVIINAKFEPDDGGDSAVHVRLLDRTRFQFDQFYPIRHYQDAEGAVIPLAELIENARRADMNLEMAATQVRRHVKLIGFVINDRKPTSAPSDGR